MKTNIIDSPSDTTLSGKTTIALREAIIRGELKPGEKLSESRLAEKFSVSRGPLREAIRRLVAMRLVHYVPNQGARVVTLSQQMVSDLFEVREALESKAAALAARNMDTKDTQNLYRLLEIHKEHLASHDGQYMHIEGDFDFHYQIVLGSKNQLLIQHLCEDLYHLIRMLRYQTSKNEQRSDTALTEHAQLIHAIEKSDAQLASSMMQSHIRHAKASSLKKIQLIKTSEKS